MNDEVRVLAFNDWKAEGDSGLSGGSCNYCGCPPSDPDCRRHLEDSAVRVLAFNAWKDGLTGGSCNYCGCPPSDPDCRRQLEETEVRVLAFKAWKAESVDE